MAKLSARGRTELARFSKQNNVSGTDRSAEWERRTYAYMSDGHLLKKYDVRFKATEYTAAYNYSYGWKDEGKRFSLDEVRMMLLAKGYTEET